MDIRDFYDDLPLGICILKRDRKNMHVLYANMVMAIMLGADRAEYLSGKDFEEIWSDKEAKKLAQKLKSTTPPRSYILPLYDAHSKKQRWIKLDITSDLWEGHDSFTLWASDISANKEAEEKLKEEVERADATAEMKSNFLATMSHEIRTPMQTIYGLLELVADEKPSEKISAMVQTAQTAASGLLEILDDILDLAKMDADKMELDVFEVPVRLLVRGTLEGLSVKVHGLKVHLCDEIEQDVPFVIIGDPKRLRQIIINLCNNAIKFTHEGTVTVRVSTKTQHISPEENQVGLRFEVVDTGIGMSEDVCARLFQSFVQADNSTARKYGGTGLGLSICKKLVELMGGKIGVESTEGKGSNFWFEIPTEEIGTETTIELPSLDGVSVLSVEDHPQGAKEIVNSLRSMGAKVESCPTYAEGLELAKRRPFDVGVIDQGLPDGLGLDLIKEIMQIRPNMGLIMYTVRDDTGLAHSLQSLGVTYLTKPASRAGLGEAVQDAASKTLTFSIDGPTRLLIAEDTESVRDVLSRQLEKVGVEADFVNDGRQALEALATGKYGILITDLHMPDIDGYELVKTIREKEEEGSEKHFPVIVLTADVQMSQRETYMSHGFDECLLKPVSLGQFRRLLIRWGLLTGEDLGSNPESASPAQTEQTESGDIPPAVDKAAMIELMGAFDENTVEMLQMFAEMTVPLIVRLQDAQVHNDSHEVAEAAHSLKGAARSACCNVLGDIAAQIQDDAEEKKDCKKLVEEALREFTRVQDEIKTLKPD